MDPFSSDRPCLESMRSAIESRLCEFAKLPKDRWLREIMFCLLTPQGTPFRAENALIQLENKGLFSDKLRLRDIEAVFANPQAYVRFHKTKAKRVVSFLKKRDLIESVVFSGQKATEEREELVRLVDGFGLKEASHALRNIGRRNLAILDRHLLRNLKRLRVISSIPASLTDKNYKKIEKAFISFASSEGETVDVLDLFFWARETGLIFK